MFGAPSLDSFLAHPVLESWVEEVELQRLNQAYASRSPLLNFEAQRRRFDGSLFWVSMTGQPFDLSGDKLTIVWHLDITDRKQTEMALREREGQLRDFIDSSIDWFWEMDADLRFTYMSDNVERIVGVPPEWHYGKTREELLGPDFDHSIWADHLATLKAHKPYRDFVYLRVGDGVEQKWLSSSGKPIFSEDGTFLGYRGTGADVTERIEIQELRLASRAKSEFLSSMSHELRTPLNAIQGFGQLLQSDPDLPLSPNQQTSVDQILRAGTHLLELVNQVLDLAKIESNDLALSIEPVETASVLSDCVAMAETMAAKRNITVQTDWPDGDVVPFVKADRTRLSQIFLNLLSNATKYNKEGGSITVSGRELSDRMYRISVSDTGIGIPTRFYDRVFAPFNRLASEGSEIEGTGIGLSISRQLVELMAGEIDFSSVEGEGSTFWFDLPIASEDDIRQWQESVRPDIDGAVTEVIEIPPSDVLYIEDNDANIQLMEMIVARLGTVRLQSAVTAELGIEQANSSPPDLILMDINLPGMSGIQALGVLRGDAKLRDIPVVAVSANAMADDITMAQKAGFDAYIVKPFDMQDVISTIGRALGAKVTDVSPEDDVPPEKDGQSGLYSPLHEKDVGILLNAAESLPPEYVAVLRKQAAAIPTLIETICGAADKGDSVGAENAAHALKTNSGTFGARELWALAQKIEQSASLDGIQSCAEIVGELDSAYGIVQPVIDRLLGDLVHNDS